MGNEWNEEGRFHTGGVVKGGKPGLRVGEVPGILRSGSEEIVPLAKPRKKTFDAPLTVHILRHHAAEELTCRMIQDNVQTFMEMHRAAGFIVTVENHSLQPFAMGYTEPRVEVRKVNSRPPEPAPNDYDKMAADAMERVKNHIELVAADFSITSAYEHHTAMDAMHNRHWRYIKTHRARCASFIRLSPAIWTYDEAQSKTEWMLRRDALLWSKGVFK